MKVLRVCRGRFGMHLSVTCFCVTCFLHHVIVSMTAGCWDSLQREEVPSASCMQAQLWQL